MVDQVREKARQVIRQLQEKGRPEEAQHLENALGSSFADAFPLVLREACQTVLTAIEAIDPNTEMLLEQLRAKIDTLLTPRHPAEPSPTDDTAAGTKDP